MPSTDTQGLFSDHWGYFVVHSKRELRSAIFYDYYLAQKEYPREKGEAGIYKISDLALTAVDLIHFQNKLGGLNRVLSILEELIEEITFSNLSDLLSWYPHTSTMQHLGYFIDGSDNDNESELVRLLVEYFRTNKYYPVLLSPNAKEKAGAVDNVWKVDVNVELESDL